jgi:hypothetical protein
MKAYVNIVAENLFQMHVANGPKELYSRHTVLAIHIYVYMYCRTAKINVKCESEI